MKARILVATLFVGILTLVVGSVWSYLSAYLLHPPDPKFGRHGSFHIGILVSACLGLCFVISFLATTPLYLRLFGERSLRQLLVYGTAFVIALYAAFQSGAVGLVFLPVNFVVRPLFGDGVAIILAFLSASLIAAWLFCRMASIVDNLLRVTIPPT
jgi:hypothetical protein